MEEKLLSSIDPVRFMKNCGWSFANRWTGKIDVSTWIRARLNAGGRMFLILEFRDEKETRAIPVDRCITTTTDSILLNGRITISGKGELELLRVKVQYEGCDGDAIVIEEVSVRSVNRRSNAKVQIAS